MNNYFSIVKILLILCLLTLVGRMASAQCISGDCKNGYGSYRYGRGTVYTGEWKDGRRNGHGITTYSNGAFYEGDYLNNLPHGYGTYQWVGGKKYVGEWKFGNYEGAGVMYYPDGTKDSGQWKNDKLANNYKEFFRPKSDHGRTELTFSKCYIDKISFLDGADTSSTYRFEYDKSHEASRIILTKGRSWVEIRAEYNMRGEMEKLSYLDRGFVKPMAEMEYSRGLPVKRTRYGDTLSYSTYTYDKDNNLNEANDFILIGGTARMQAYTSYKYDDSHNLIESRYHVFDAKDKTFHLETTRKYEPGKDPNPLRPLMLLFGANELTVSPTVISKKTVTQRDGSTQEISGFSTVLKGYLTGIKEICDLKYLCD